MVYVAVTRRAAASACACVSASTRAIDWPAYWTVCCRATTIGSGVAPMLKKLFGPGRSAAVITRATPAMSKHQPGNQCTSHHPPTWCRQRHRQVQSSKRCRSHSAHRKRRKQRPWRDWHVVRVLRLSRRLQHSRQLRQRLRHRILARVCRKALRARRDRSHKRNSSCMATSV